MAKTRRERLTESLLRGYKSPERQAAAFYSWLKELESEECPRCNARNVELTEQPVSTPEGRVTRVCQFCIREIKQVVPIYTKR